MPQYVLKILIDCEACDDLAARQDAATWVRAHLAQTPGIRDIVLHAKDDNKSIRLNPDGAFQGQWQKGGTK